MEVASRSFGSNTIAKQSTVCTGLRENYNKKCNGELKEGKLTLAEDSNCKKGVESLPTFEMTTKRDNVATKKKLLMCTFVANHEYDARD